MSTMPYEKVVKVYATTQKPDYEDPWQTVAAVNATGSGVVIGPGQVLTGAHVVADATFIRVKRASTDDKAVAMVKAICHDADLALLQVVDDAYLKGIDPAEIGDLPSLRDEVSVVGYPVGGHEISITEGVVSRVEVQKYSHSQRHFLAVTVDAAINEGNSGGPVFRENKMVGIAFQTLKDAENIGEIVPTPLIQHFLRGVAQEKPTTVPAFGLRTQNLENPAMRTHLKIPSNTSGVLVVGVTHEGSCDGVLQDGDVLLSVAGLTISNNGTINYHDRFRTAYHVVLAEHFVGDVLSVVIWRDGVEYTKDLTLQPYRTLVPRSQYDIQPPFFVYAGFVFQVLSQDLLSTWDTWWEKAPAEFIYAYYFGKSDDTRDELVVVSQVLADEINVGYEHVYSEVVTEVNGVAVRNLAHMMQLVDAVHAEPVLSESDTISIITTTGALVVLNAKDSALANQRIRKRYQIAAERTTELGFGRS